MRILLVVFAAWTMVHAQPNFESLETLESVEELENVRTWIRRIQMYPAETGREFAEYFRHLPPHAWIQRYQVELKALDLLAYYLEMERARETDAAAPPHAARDQHLEFYARKIHPSSHLTRNGVLDSAARIFADQFLRELERDEDPAPRFELFKKIVGSGRAFWSAHLLEQLFVRSAPAIAHLGPLMSHVRESEFARFARVIAEHRFDFRHAQTLIDELARARASRDPDAPEPETGDADCDQMLTIARAKRPR